MVSENPTDVEAEPSLHILKSGGVAGTEVVEPQSEADDDSRETYRRNFLSGFTAKDDRRIMRKVDLRFLPLMGFMYLVKQIDYTNAASIKVLQVGQPSNVLTELGMSADQYNWIQTVYFVRPFARPSPPLHSISPYFVISRVLIPSLSDQLRDLRGPKQPRSQKGHPPKMADTHFSVVGNCSGLPCRDPEQRGILCSPLPPWHDGGGLFSWPGGSNVQLVQK